MGQASSSTIPVAITDRFFSGQVLDISTGPHYYGNGRYYDSSIGRYISPDPYLDAPISSQRPDRYNFGFNNPPPHKRSEALPDFTVDLAKGTQVADAVSPASLTSSLSQLLTPDTMGWLRRGTTVGKLAYGGLPKLAKADYMATGGLRVVARGTCASGLPRLMVYRSQWSKGRRTSPPISLLRAQGTTIWPGGQALARSGSRVSRLAPTRSG